MNGDAIYGTRPWKTFGEGPTKVVEGAFHDTDVQAYTPDDYRFTLKGTTLYAIELKWPTSREAIVRSLKSDQPDVVETVSLLGSKDKLHFEQKPDGLHIQLPAQAPGKYAYAYRIGLRPRLPSRFQLQTKKGIREGCPFSASFEGGLRQVVAERSPEHVFDSLDLETVRLSCERSARPGLTHSIGILEAFTQAAFRSLVEVIPEAAGEFLHIASIQAASTGSVIAGRGTLIATRLFSSASTRARQLGPITLRRQALCSPSRSWSQHRRLESLQIRHMLRG